MRRRWREADSSRRRELIVDAACDLLAHLGLEAVTMRRVAAKLGVGAMTLYTYVRGQEQLRLAMMQRGFALLRQSCENCSTLGTPQGWRGSAQAYIRFALTHPKLYELMFATPVAQDAGDKIGGEFEVFFNRVRSMMKTSDIPATQHDAIARQAAGRYWIALHGLASLAIAGRLHVLHADLDAILDDLVHNVAPDLESPEHAPESPA